MDDDYDTCPYCGWAGKLRKDGMIRKHRERADSGRIGSTGSLPQDPHGPICKGTGAEPWKVELPGTYDLLTNEHGGFIRNPTATSEETGMSEHDEKGKTAEARDESADPEEFAAQNHLVDPWTWLRRPAGGTPVHAPCSCPRGESEVYAAHHRTICAAATCKHGNTPRTDVAGDPITACANAGGGTEWGAFNAEGCTYAYECAVDVANESAKENEEAASRPSDPESRWHEMCPDHRDQEQPKDGCEECFAEAGDEDSE